jgi:hypothetical protein
MSKPFLRQARNFFSMGPQLGQEDLPTKIRWLYSMRTPVFFMMSTTSSSPSSRWGFAVVMR